MYHRFHDKHIILTIIILTLCCYFSGTTAQIQAQDGEFVYSDKIYRKNIKTVLLYPANASMTYRYPPPIIPANNTYPLILKFDELYVDVAPYYQAKILHCNADWTPSGISDMHYIDHYNEYNIDDFEFSMATKTPYIHYTLEIPPVKMPGNYLLVVYDADHKDDIIITRRFIVYDQQIKIEGDIALPGGVRERLVNQQIDFIIDYKLFPVSNPLLDFKVVIRQNNRWDNAIYDIKPTMIRDDLKQLVYRSINFENNFKGGNEFRVFSIKSRQFAGKNVDKMDVSRTQVDVYLFVDKPRNTEPYSIEPDRNGEYFIETTDGSDPMTESDYFNVHFLLKAPETYSDDIYIAGKLTDWTYNPSNKMEYLPASGLYNCNLLLKQGIYDYIYYMPYNTADPYQIEGSHFTTRNSYDIIIYYFDYKINADVVVGYAQF